MAPTPSPNTRVHPAVFPSSNDKPLSDACVVAYRELWGISTGTESPTTGLVKLADIYMDWRYVTGRRILTNQRGENSHCGTVLDASRRNRILTPNESEQLYLFLSKLHRETTIIAAVTSSKSGVFTNQLTCSTHLSLRADSSRIGATSRLADESTRPLEINKPDSRVPKH